MTARDNSNELDNTFIMKSYINVKNMSKWFMSNYIYYSRYIVQTV